MKPSPRSSARSGRLSTAGRIAARAAFALATAGGVGTAFADRGVDDELVRLAADDPAVVARGETIYAEQCASCHGADLEGQPDWRTRDANGLLPAPPHDETGHTWHHADDLLFEITKYGPARTIGDATYRSAMPAYESVLEDEAIVAVLSFIKSRWPEKERGWQEEVNDAQLDAMGVVDPEESVLDRLFR